MAFFATIAEENVARSLIRQGHPHEESSYYYGGQHSGLRGLTCRTFGTVLR